MVLIIRSTIRLTKAIVVDCHGLCFIVRPMEGLMVNLDLCSDIAIARLYNRLSKVDIFVADIVARITIRLWTLDPTYSFCNAFTDKTRLLGVQRIDIPRGRLLNWVPLIGRRHNQAITLVVVYSFDEC